MTALWIVPVIAAIGYFAGAMAAIAIVSAMVLGIAFCLYPAIDHAIDLNRTNFK